MAVSAQLRYGAFLLLLVLLLVLPSFCDITMLSAPEEMVENKREKGLENVRGESDEEGTKEEHGRDEEGKLWNNRPIIGILAQEVYGDLLEEVLKQLGTQKSSSADSIQKLVDPATDLNEGFSRHGGGDGGGAGGRVRHQTSHNHLLRPVQLDLNRLPRRGHDVHAIVPFTSEPVVETSRRLQGNSVDQFLKSERTEYHRWEGDFEGEPGPAPKKNMSYIAASYVKFVESGGARAVPIMIDKDDEYYEKMFQSLNGVLFPGGAVAVDQTSGFGRAGKLIYEKARASSLAGDPFPLWGTCLGFELLMFLAAGGKELRTRCQGQNLASTTKETSAAESSRLLRQMPPHLRHVMRTQPLAANFHYLCVTPENFTAFNVSTDFDLLATSSDAEGLKYVAMAEGAQGLPFFAVQFHPEKNLFEWTTLENHNAIPHTTNAAAFASYFARFFVDQARRSQHSFSSPEEEQAALIYNFNPVSTPNTALEQVYVFPLD